MTGNPDPTGGGELKYFNAAEAHQQLLTWIEDISKKVTQLQLAQERMTTELQGVRAVLQGLRSASKAKPGRPTS